MEEPGTDYHPSIASVLLAAAGEGTHGARKDDLVRAWHRHTKANIVYNLFARERHDQLGVGGPSSWSFPTRSTRDRVGHLTALWAEEDNPHSQALAEVLEMMFGSSGDEQKIAWLEWISLGVVAQDAPAANNDVDLVLGMGRLFVRVDWKRELDVEGTASQEASRMLACRPRDKRSSVCKSNQSATIWRGHGHLPCVPIRSRSRR